MVSLDFDNDGVSNAQEYSDGTDPSMPPGGLIPLVINEVDYDQIGNDTTEFVEIFNPSASTVSLSGLALVLVNGNDNNEYGRVDLGPAGSLDAGEYLVIGSATLLATLPPTTKTVAFSKAMDNVQNGAPDGLAIINVAPSTLIDALSYEGAMPAANITGFPNSASLVEGTALAANIADSNSAVGSLSRLPNGQDTNDSATDWKFTTTPTPGRANVP